MSRSYKFANPQGLYFISFATVNWIDVFIRRPYKDILIESLKYCQREKGLELFAYVIMTSHMHLQGPNRDVPWLTSCGILNSLQAVRY